MGRSTVIWICFKVLQGAGHALGTAGPTKNAFESRLSGGRGPSYKLTVDIQALKHESKGRSLLYMVTQDLKSVEILSCLCLDCTLT